MPTGYTADIKDGISFKTFAMNCARAFGACVQLRDKSGGGEVIPEEFKPFDYHLNSLERVKQQLRVLTILTISQLQYEANEEYDNNENHRKVQLKDMLMREQAYKKMLEKVNNWMPPTKEHEELKNFMQQQIQESIDFDCRTKIYDTPTILLTAEDYFKERKSKLEAEINYHKEAYDKEVKSCQERTDWVKKLKASL